MTSVILTERIDCVAVITLNRPDRMNAMNPALISGLHAALKQAGEDEAVKAVVLTGAGSQAFCSGDDLGDDLTAYTAEELRQHAETVQDITRLILFGEKPVVAAVNGWAVGGGFEWVVNCDFSIWADGSKAFMPELDWGLFVTGAITVLLPQMVGLQRARELLFLGRKIDAADAVVFGLAHASLPLDQVRDAAIALAQQIGSKPSRVVAAMKRGLQISNRSALEEALSFEVDVLVEAMQDPEALARIAAFSEEKAESKS